MWLFDVQWEGGRVGGWEGGREERFLPLQKFSYYGKSLCNETELFTQTLNY